MCSITVGGTAARLPWSIVALLTLIALGWPVPGSARFIPDPAAICDQVAAEAAMRAGVPVSVLRAISLTETGRSRDGAVRPWPWTVNMEGKGLWFDNEAEARAYVRKHYRRGARSFDVGCFQINFKWHGTAFRSIDDMFDPLTNALYAARFLKELHDEHGSWSLAAGAYHSRTPEFADRYRARFDRFRRALQGAEAETVPEIPDIVLTSAGSGLPRAEREPRVNRFPLLQTGDPSGLGSLVPLEHGAGVGLFNSRTAPEGE